MKRVFLMTALLLLLVLLIPHERVRGQDETVAIQPQAIIHTMTLFVAWEENIAGQATVCVRYEAFVVCQDTQDNRLVISDVTVVNNGDTITVELYNADRAQIGRGNTVIGSASNQQLHLPQLAR